MSSGIQRNCSIDSMSTIGSRNSCSEYEDNDHPDLIDCQIMPQLPPQPQQVPQIPQIPQLYREKRKNIMQWVQHYSHHLHLSHSSKALSQILADLYYYNNCYDSDRCKPVLCALLILASKFLDYKILYTRYMANICQIDQAVLTQCEVDAAIGVGFQLCRPTYVTVVDQVITDMLDCGWDMYTQNQGTYCMLRLLHLTAQSLYTNPKQFPVSLPPKAALLHSLLSYIGIKNLRNNSHVSPLVAYLRQELGKSGKTGYEEQVEEIVREWVKGQGKFRDLFRGRKGIEKYESYAQFCIQYFM